MRCRRERLNALAKKLREECWYNFLAKRDLSNHRCVDFIIDNITSISNFVLSSGADIILRLSDNAGASKVSIEDSDEAEVASIDSDGNLTSVTMTANEGTLEFLDLSEISTPPAPDENKIRMYSVEDDDFTVIETITNLGIVNRVMQDSFRIARNTSGSEIAKAKVCYITGSTGNRPNFALAKADSEATLPAVGMTGAAVNNNNFGQLKIVGRISGIKTDYTNVGEPLYAPGVDWAEGDPLYVSPNIAGELINERPLHPNLAQLMGVVEVVHAINGAILVVTQAITGIEDGTNRINYKVGSGGVGHVIVPKEENNGIKVDVLTPTFGWRDLLGKVTNAGGANKPTNATYRGGISQFQFSAGDESIIEFHIPHDYVKGTDIFLHVHWSHISTLVTGGTITFTAESIYAKGHNQAPFSAPATGTFTGDASTTQYQHIVSETQLSASTPGGLQIDTDDLEPDGVIIMRLEMTTNNITSSGAVPDPFIHFVDVHYQSTNIATKDKAPDFYA